MIRPAQHTRRERAPATGNAPRRSRRNFFTCALFAFYSSLMFPATAPAQTPNRPPPPPPAHGPPPGLSFENYRMVRTRNVFDPDRRPLLAAQASAAAVAPIQQSDYVALTGTMLNAGKALAFFSGSRTDFNKVLGEREKIAGATITSITAAGVEVDRGGKKVTVAVGQTVPLDNSAPTSAPTSAPAAVLAAQPPTGTPAATAGAANPANPTAAATPVGGLTDKQQETMRRMMEKRKQDGLQ